MKHLWNVSTFAWLWCLLALGCSVNVSLSGVRGGESTTDGLADGTINADEPFESAVSDKERARAEIARGEPVVAPERPKDARDASDTSPPQPKIVTRATCQPAWNGLHGVLFLREQWLYVTRYEGVSYVLDVDTCEKREVIIPNGSRRCHRYAISPTSHTLLCMAISNSSKIKDMWLGLLDIPSSKWVGQTMLELGGYEFPANMSVLRRARKLWLPSSEGVVQIDLDARSFRKIPLSPKESLLSPFAGPIQAGNGVNAYPLRASREGKSVFSVLVDWPATSGRNTVRIAEGSDIAIAAVKAIGNRIYVLRAVGHDVPVNRILEVYDEAGKRLKQEVVPRCSKLLSYGSVVGCATWLKMFRFEASTGRALPPLTFPREGRAIDEYRDVVFWRTATGKPSLFRCSWASATPNCVSLALPKDAGELLEWVLPERLYRADTPSDERVLRLLWMKEKSTPTLRRMLLYDVKKERVIESAKRFLFPDPKVKDTELYRINSGALMYTLQAVDLRTGTRTAFVSLQDGSLLHDLRTSGGLNGVDSGMPHEDFFAHQVSRYGRGQGHNPAWVDMFHVKRRLVQRIDFGGRTELVGTYTSRRFLVVRVPSFPSPFAIYRVLK